MDKQRARRSASIPVRIGHAAAWAAGLWKQEHLRTLITGVQRFVLCAVLAQGTILGGYMPFGLAMTAALMARGAGLSALGGLVCGVMLRGDGFHGGIYAAAALLVLCVMSVCAGLRVMSERWFAPGVATFASAACTFVFLPLGAELTAPAVLTFLLVQGITFGVCWMYGAAFAPPRDENDWRRPVTLLVLTATVLLSLSGINLFGVFAPARAGALLLVLAALNDVTQPMLQRGRAEMSDFPYHFAARCARADACHQQCAVCAARARKPSAAAGGKPEPACQAIRRHYGHSSAAWRGGHAG